VHAEPRATKDLDLFIRPDEENSNAIFRALAQYGASLGDLSPADFMDGTIFQIGQPPARVDILQEVFETSSKPHPGFFFYFQASLELLRDGFGYKGAWDAWAATDLARRKMGSGVSRVVFTLSGSPMYGRYV
jgi:hypothetical protein